MASVQLAAGRGCVAGEVFCSPLDGGAEGQRKPEPDRSLLSEGLDCSLESVAYAPLGDSSFNEGDAGGRSRNWLLGDAGECEAGV